VIGKESVPQGTVLINRLKLAVLRFLIEEIDRGDDVPGVVKEEMDAEDATFELPAVEVPCSSRPFSGERCAVLTVLPCERCWRFSSRYGFSSTYLLGCQCGACRCLCLRGAWQRREEEGPLVRPEGRQGRCGAHRAAHQKAAAELWRNWQWQRRGRMQCEGLVLIAGEHNLGDRGLLAHFLRKVSSTCTLPPSLAEA
jgi:hypothetical protein